MAGHPLRIHPFNFWLLWAPGTGRFPACGLPSPFDRTTSCRDCVLQYQHDPDQEVFQGFCLSKPLLVQRAACSAKKKMKKSGRFWCSWNSWRGREKGSYCSELRWKAKALKTFKNLKCKGEKKSSAYLCRGQSWLCILWMAPSSGLAGLSPSALWLSFSLLILKLNYFGWSGWTFLFRNSREGYLEIFFLVLFSNKKKK